MWGVLIRCPLRISGQVAALASLNGRICDFFLTDNIALLRKELGVRYGVKKFALVQKCGWPCLAFVWSEGDRTCPKTVTKYIFGGLGTSQARRLS